MNTLESSFITAEEKNLQAIKTVKISAILKSEIEPALGKIEEKQSSQPR